MSNEDIKEKISNEVIKDFVWRRRWRLVTWVGVSIFAMLAVVKYFLAYGLPTFGNQIAVIDINGEIGQGYIASADKVVPVLRNAFQNEDVKVVILEINSGGGSPSEAERITSEIDRLKKRITELEEKYLALEDEYQDILKRVDLLEDDLRNLDSPYEPSGGRPTIPDSGWVIFGGTKNKKK